MANEQVIANFLRPPIEGGAYTDDKLAALLKHAESGKLSFWSCCCFAGIPSALHSLRGKIREQGGVNTGMAEGHGPRLDYDAWGSASGAFCRLAREDTERRARLIPLIKSEMNRRADLRAHAEASEMVMA